jgi:ribosomal protein L18E
MRSVLIALLVLASVPAFPNTGPYGRLFLTPQERAALEEARRHKVRESAKPVKKAIAVSLPKPERPSGNVTLNGIVRRSDGESTVWVNGVAMPGDAQTGKVQVAPTSSQSGVIQIPNTHSGGRVELKVGQKLDMSNGQVTERYVNRTLNKATRNATSYRAPPRASRRERPVESDEQDRE